MKMMQRVTVPQLMTNLQLTQAIAEMNIPSSSNQSLAIDERLNQLLQPERSSKAVKTAKYFLGNLGAVNLENPEILGKVHEYVSTLKPYANEEESVTLGAFEARLEAIPRLKTAVVTASSLMQQQIAQRTALEARLCLQRKT